MDDTDPQPGEAGRESTELHTEAIEPPTTVAEPVVEVSEIQSEAKGPLLDTTEPPTNSIPEMLKPTISISSDIQDWTHITMTAAFFVVMGGVAYRRRNYLGIPNSEIKYPNLALTPVGFLELAKVNVFHQGYWTVKALKIAVRPTQQRNFWYVHRLCGWSSTLLRERLVVYRLH